MVRTNAKQMCISVVGMKMFDSRRKGLQKKYNEIYINKTKNN